MKLSRKEFEEIVAEVESVFSHHGAARNKTLSLPDTVPRRVLRTDSSLVIRIVTNLLLNAFEASGEGEEVRLGIGEEEGRVVFTVWNRKAIPAAVVPRIFQRHFSTKEGEGRGFGTFSVKLIGEKVLGGRVGFSSSEAAGTEFRFALPC